MHALFVHGMGRSIWSGWPMLRQLAKAGLRTSSHGYNVSLQRFDVIRDGLVQRIHGMAGQEFVLIGHSLGGVLIRAALAAMPPDATRPKHIFLLGSPLRPSCLAQRLQPNPVFRLVTRDCGHLLSSAERMGQIAIPPGPLTSIVGVKGLTGRLSPFGAEPNDGVVSLSEVSSVNIPDQVRLPIVHTLLPSSTEVAKVILQRIGPLAER